MTAEELEYWTARLAENLHRTERLRLWNYAALILTIIIAGTVLWVTLDRYNGLRGEVVEACAGRVAALDLTEWVPVCRRILEE